MINRIKNATTTYYYQELSNTTYPTIKNYLTEPTKVLNKTVILHKKTKDNLDVENIALITTELKRDERLPATDLVSKYYKTSRRPK